VIAAGGKGGGRRILFLLLFLPSFCFGKDTPACCKAAWHESFFCGFFVVLLSEFGAGVWGSGFLFVEVPG
jgi:hypothetical protein